MQCRESTPTSRQSRLTPAAAVTRELLIARSYHPPSFIPSPSTPRHSGFRSDVLDRNEKAWESAIANFVARLAAMKAVKRAEKPFSESGPSVFYSLDVVWFQKTRHTFYKQDFFLGVFLKLNTEENLSNLANKRRISI